ILTTWLACLSAAESRAAQFTVVLDPGHSPKSPGAISARGVPEVDFNDKLTAAIAKELNKDPRFKVEITRGPKKNLPLKKRARLINALDPDLVLSIHHDSVQPHFLKPWELDGQILSYSDRFSGFSLFVPAKGYYAPLSKRAATLMADGLHEIGLSFASYHAQAIPGESRKWLDSARGIYAGDFLYLARTIKRPFVLFEAGVLVNRAEEERLSDSKQIKKMAGAIVKSIRDLACQFERDRRTRD
ncbi:MAG: N-acetylmuramoyl-L-alanine amidase, partial [Deltaproteobacteria bacterium]|nr:N-acetylmuramoyl-L-alanine amidase [Deltaproteobacteria bacterium]